MRIMLAWLKDHPDWRSDALGVAALAALIAAVIWIGFGAGLLSVDGGL